MSCAASVLRFLGVFQTEWLTFRDATPGSRSDPEAAAASYVSRTNLCVALDKLEFCRILIILFCLFTCSRKPRAKTPQKAILLDEEVPKVVVDISLRFCRIHVNASALCAPPLCVSASLFWLRLTQKFHQWRAVDGIWHQRAAALIKPPFSRAVGLDVWAPDKGSSVALS